MWGLGTGVLFSTEDGDQLWAKTGVLLCFQLKKKDKMTWKFDDKTFRIYHKGYILRKKKICLQREENFQFKNNVKLLDYKNNTYTHSTLNLMGVRVHWYILILDH